jgi:hypothetical protein
MDDAQIAELGPLAPLAGLWEGEKGDDIAPSDDRGTENNKYRERILFEVISPVQNHEQKLFGLRYHRTAWRLGEAAPFHEDLGYWLWDPAAKQVMRCFIVPRGVAVIAGGTVELSARTFTLTAESGSSSYGVCSNQFLDRNFKTLRFELTVTIHDGNSYSYAEDTQLQIPGQTEVFHHRDSNTLTRVVAKQNHV